MAAVSSPNNLSKSDLPFAPRSPAADPVALAKKYQEEAVYAGPTLGPRSRAGSLSIEFPDEKETDSLVGRSPPRPSNRSGYGSFSEELHPATDAPRSYSQRICPCLAVSAAAIAVLVGAVFFAKGSI